MPTQRGRQRGGQAGTGMMQAQRRHSKSRHADTDASLQHTSLHSTTQHFTAPHSTLSHPTPYHPTPHWQPSNSLPLAVPLQHFDVALGNPRNEPERLNSGSQSQVSTLGRHPEARFSTADTYLKGRNGCGVVHLLIPAVHASLHGNGRRLRQVTTEPALAVSDPKVEQRNTAQPHPSFSQSGCRPGTLRPCCRSCWRAARGPS